MDLDKVWHSIIHNNDRESFEAFFDYYYPRLYQFSLKFVKHPVYAEEVVSEVIFLLLKKSKRQSEIQNVNAYLYKSVRNRCLNLIKSQKKFLVIADEFQIEDYIIEREVSHHQMHEDTVEMKVLDEAVRQLPSQRQMVYKMIREEGLTVNEVSEILDLSVRTVEKHLELAIADLCKALKSFIENKRHHPKVRRMFPRNFIFF